MVLDSKITGQVCYTIYMANRPFIILIDDDKDFVDLYSTKLVASGFEVQGATNGQEGLNAFSVRKPDLLLLDIMMPGMNGIEVLSKIKADPSLKNLPVVLLTSLANTTSEGISIGGIDLKSAQKMSKVYFMKKDIDLAEFVSKLKEILAKNGK